jgi:hypothetical protein
MNTDCIYVVYKISIKLPNRYVYLRCDLFLFRGPSVANVIVYALYFTIFETTTYITPKSLCYTSACVLHSNQFEKI